MTDKFESFPARRLFWLLFYLAAVVLCIVIVHRGITAGTMASEIAGFYTAMTAVLGFSAGAEFVLFLRDLPD